MHTHIYIYDIILDVHKCIHTPTHDAIPPSEKKKKITEGYKYLE